MFTSNTVGHTTLLSPSSYFQGKLVSELENRAAFLADFGKGKNVMLIFKVPVPVERTDDEDEAVCEDGVRTHVPVVVLGGVPAEPADDDGKCTRPSAEVKKLLIAYHFDDPHFESLFLNLLPDLLFHTGKITGNLNLR